MAQTQRLAERTGLTWMAYAVLATVPLRAYLLGRLGIIGLVFVCVISLAYIYWCRALKRTVHIRCTASVLCRTSARLATPMSLRTGSSRSLPPYLPPGHRYLVPVFVIKESAFSKITFPTLVLQLDRHYAYLRGSNDLFRKDAPLFLCIVSPVSGNHPAATSPQMS